MNDKPKCGHRDGDWVCINDHDHDVLETHGRVVSAGHYYVKADRL